VTRPKSHARGATGSRPMTGKVALIAGATSGIGRATAELFAARGAAVVLAARREDLLSQLAAAINAQGGTATFLRTDVSVATDVERLVAHAVQVFGRLDFAANCAGVEGRMASITELAESDWDAVLDTNLKGTFLCMKFEAQAMLACGGSAIVNVGSVNSFLGFARGSAYSASKHAQVGLTTSVSAELAPQGIRVNLVCPGIVDTPMHHRLRGSLGKEMYERTLQQRVHLRRTGTPEEIANVIVFLCSDEASYITGTTVTPDGGFALSR
jgi:NAD(P)-dependent dehydrogenase (short-subunit alcohol dehydrogenase family)